MRVYVMGSSVLVTSLIQWLLKAGHQVVHILFGPGESSPLNLGDEVVETVVGDGPTMDVLKRAGIGGADVFLALSEDDNRNVMAAQVAQRLFKVPKAVCLVHDPERVEVYGRLGLIAICPTSVATEVIGEVLRR